MFICHIIKTRAVIEVILLLTEKALSASLQLKAQYLTRMSSRGQVS
jgi:hypothetical protein